MIHLVGDVQGCDEALAQLLLMLDFSPSRDRIVLLGDLVNRGPASLAVLRRVATLGDAAVCLLGNHDLHLLAVAHGVRGLHKGDTFNDVLQDADAPRWIDWIRQQKLAHLEAGWLCVHAGVVPQWSTTQTLLLLVGTVASGLASRRDPAVFPAFIVLYAGDVLRASMVFRLLPLLRPHGDRKTLGATSAATWWAWYSRR